MRGGAATLRARRAAHSLRAVRPLVVWLLVARILLVSEAGAQSPPQPPEGVAAGPSPVLRIGAAASLGEVIEDLQAIFAETHPEVRLEVALDGSSALAAKLRAGEPLDLILTADDGITAALTDEGLTEAPVTFSGNRLAVVVSAALDGEITSAPQLARPAVRRLALPEDSVPAGRYARAWLAQQGLLHALQDRIVATPDAAAALARVERGEAEAAVVYRSDARHAESARLAFEVPFLEQPRIAYAGAVVKGSASSDLARAFLATLREPRVSALLIRDGFTLAPLP